MARLLNIFYRTRVPCYPVVELSQDKKPVEWKILGWITRDLLDPWMSDLSRSQQEYTKIPIELMSSSIPRILRENLGQIEQIPVLDIQGVQVANYSREDVLYLLRTTIEQEPKTRTGNRTENDIPITPEAGDLAPNNSPDQKARMSSLILGSVPVPMYAADLEGNTLFYNREFEKNILSLKKLSDSIRVAERYFRELSIQILTNTYASTDKEAFRLFDVSLDCEIQMCNLVQEGRITGYLFILEKPGKSDLTHVWRKRLQENGDLESLMDDIESRLIYESLNDNKNNISHTAKSLGLKRSTLQTKIKRLNIDKRFSTKKSLTSSNLDTNKLKARHSQSAAKKKNKPVSGKKISTVPKRNKSVTPLNREKTKIQKKAPGRITAKKNIQTKKTSKKKSAKKATSSSPRATRKTKKKN